ncbi:MAG: TRAP transporter small permease subunit [Gammaproteobacteria bacterium]|nr:TRAP transporter small permease subunit [Gammaproteobacteria bacterium]
MKTAALERVKIVRLITRVLEWLGAAVLAAMMALTFIDVLGRYLFSAPVPGGFEITELLLAAMIYFGLPLITLRDGHITVDLLEGLFPGWLRELRDRFVSLLVTVALGYIAWRLFGKAGDFVHYNDQTAVLNIPLAPVCYTMATLATLSTLLAAILVVTGRRIAAPAAEDRAL